jgi:hypothetical protein
LTTFWQLFDNLERERVRETDIYIERDRNFQKGRKKEREGERGTEKKGTEREQERKRDG